MFKIQEINTTLNIAEIYNIFKDKKNTILLDSSKEDKSLSKFSFIGLNEFLIFESYGDKAYINDEYIEGEPFTILQNLIEEYSFDFNIDIPLIAGALGYISYDNLRILESIPNTSTEDIKIPDMRFMFYDNIIIHDIEKERKYITTLGILKNGEETIEDILKLIANGTNIEEEAVVFSGNNFHSNFTKDEYKEAVSKVKEYIENGHVYITNLTQRFMCENCEESFNIYKKLRTINKAPFSAYVNYEDFQIISSSPERFIQIVDNKAHTRPIKGTRPRGNTADEDKTNKLELLNSEKDKAELLMVVDLERNDFSKVCEKNTVKVTELFKLEEYATVFHLVSTVEGNLKKNVKAVNFIKECFPGGSITGTPKIRAMEIIEELEGLKRNIYTGCIGYFDFRGNADFNITIRTIVKKDNKAYFGVGGGITYDSVEEDEYNETLDKARALMRVL